MHLNKTHMFVFFIIAGIILAFIVMSVVSNQDHRNPVVQQGGVPAPVQDEGFISDETEMFLWGIGTGIAARSAWDYAISPRRDSWYEPRQYRPFQTRSVPDYSRQKTGWSSKPNSWSSKPKGWGYKPKYRAKSFSRGRRR